MKTILKLMCALLLCLLTTPFLHAQPKEGYEIEGHFVGLNDGAKIITEMFVYVPGDVLHVHKDSAYAKDGKFMISGEVPEGPRMYLLEIDAKVARFFMHLFIDNGQHLTIRSDRDLSKMGHIVLDELVTYDGSPTQYAYKLFERFGQVYDLANEAIGYDLKKVRDSLGYDTTSVKYLIQTRRDFAKGTYARYLSDVTPALRPAITFFAKYEQDDHSAFWADVYDKLDNHQKESYLGKSLKQKLPLLEGQKMPEFSLPDPSGKKIALVDIIKTGKVTLVRFWANKSVARREFDTELREMYKKFHAKGLNIISISTESDETNWKAALAIEKYPWFNVFDSKGKIVVDNVYHELGQVDHQNTTNVLLDKDGKIIAWDTSGIELQYYLINALGN